MGMFTNYVVLSGFLSKNIYSNRDKIIMNPELTLYALFNVNYVHSYFNKEKGTFEDNENKRVSLSCIAFRAVAKQVLSLAPSSRVIVTGSLAFRQNNNDNNQEGNSSYDYSIRCLVENVGLIQNTKRDINAIDDSIQIDNDAIGDIPDLL